VTSFHPIYTDFAVCDKSTANAVLTLSQPGIEGVQALADISAFSAMLSLQRNPCTDCNPPNSAQLEGTAYHSPNLHPGPCSSVGMRRGTGIYTDGRGHYTFRLGYASSRNVINDKSNPAARFMTLYIPCTFCNSASVNLDRSRRC